MLKIQNLLSIGVLMASLTACFEAGPKTEKQLESYAIGVRLAQKYKESGLELDPQMLALAVRDFNQGAPSKISDDELRNWDYHTLQKISSRRQQDAEKNLKTAKVDIENYLKEPGVKRTNSGLLYKVISRGKGAKVKPSKRVVVHYTGRLMNGKVFDSSINRGRPAEFQLTNIIPGLKEALLMMQEGQKNEVVIPPDLAYGTSGSNNIPPNAVLKFELEVKKVK